MTKMRSCLKLSVVHESRAEDRSAAAVLKKIKWCLAVGLGVGFVEDGILLVYVSHSVDGRNPAPVDFAISDCLLMRPRWCRISSIDSFIVRSSLSTYSAMMHKIWIDQLTNQLTQVLCPMFLKPPD